MQRLSYVLVLCCFFIPSRVASAPLYRAGQTTPSSFAQSAHGEITASYQFSNVSLQDYKGQYASAHLRGGNIRALWSALPWLAIGVDYTRLGTVNLKQAFVRAYTLSRTGAVIKLTLSPDTNPRFYLLGGMGQNKHQLKFTQLFAPYKETGLYEMAGLGVETTVYKSLFAAAEANAYWNQNSHFHPHYKLSNRLEIMLGFRAGIRF